MICTKCAREFDPTVQPDLDEDPLCVLCQLAQKQVPTGRYALMNGKYPLLVKITRTNGSRRWTTIEITTPERFPDWILVTAPNSRNLLLHHLRNVDLNVASEQYTRYIQGSQ